MSMINTKKESDKRDLLMINEAERAQQLKEVTAKLIKVQMFGAIGWILVGLAIYGIWGAQGNAFHPLLNDSNVVYGMLTVGIVIMVVEMAIYIPLLKKHVELTKSSK